MDKGVASMAAKEDVRAGRIGCSVAADKSRGMYYTLRALLISSCNVCNAQSHACMHQKQKQ